MLTNSITANTAHINSTTCILAPACCATTTVVSTTPCANIAQSKYKVFFPLFTPYNTSIVKPICIITADILSIPPYNTIILLVEEKVHLTVSSLAPTNASLNVPLFSVNNTYKF